MPSADSCVIFLVRKLKQRTCNSSPVASKSSPVASKTSSLSSDSSELAFKSSSLSSYLSYPY